MVHVSLRITLRLGGAAVLEEVEGVFLNPPLLSKAAQ